MKVVYKGSLQRTMIIYFLMISLASLLVAGEFIFDIHSQDPRSRLTLNSADPSSGDMQIDAAFLPMRALRNKAILMVILFLVIVLILLTMFIKHITEPLQHMIEASRLIADGDLSQTLNVQSKNELAEMGNTVNELTSNLQELLLLSKDMCATVDEFTGEASDVLSAKDVDPEKTMDLQHKMHLLNSKSKLMKDIILHCKFYGIGR